jgi:thioredoxin-like negative regulator of GroEL
MFSGRVAAFIVVLGVCFAAQLSSVVAQTKTNISGTGGIHQIKGKVYLPNGTAVDSPIEIELQSTTFASLKVMTDVSGSFAFENLAPGSYTVVVNAGDQFEIARESVLIDGEVQLPTSIRPPARTKIFTVPMYLQIKRPSGPHQKTGVIDAKWAEIDKDAVDHLEQGNKNALNKQLDRAEAEYRRSIEIAPTYAPAYLALGKLLLTQGRLEEAISELHMAVRYDPTDFEARLSIGIAMLNQRQVDNAQRELNEAATLNKTAVTPRYYLGIVFVQKKDMDRAQKEFETAREMTGDKPFPLLHRYLGGVYIAKQMNKEALAELELYIKQDPSARDGDRIKQTIADLKSKSN